MAPPVIGIQSLRWFTLWTFTKRFLPSSLWTFHSVFRLWLVPLMETMWVHPEVFMSSQSSYDDEEQRLFTLCYLTSLISVAAWGVDVDFAKSLVITSSSPSLRTQRCTILRTFSNLRSRAEMWGSVRIGCKGSAFRDSLITSLSLYSRLVRSWRRIRVECFILRRQRGEFDFKNLCIKKDGSPEGQSMPFTVAQPLTTNHFHAQHFTKQN